MGGIAVGVRFGRMASFDSDEAHCRGTTHNSPALARAKRTG